MILRRALEWHRHLCLWGRRASRLPRDEFAVVRPAAYHFETAGRMPALPTAKMAVPRIHGSKKPKKACYLFHDSINPENSAPKKYKKVLTRFWRFSHKRRFTLKFHPHHNRS